MSIEESAQALANSLNEDIRNASTRIEHIRLTQHAAQAEALVRQIQLLTGPELPTH